MKPEIISGVHSVYEALRAGRRKFYWISIARGAEEKRFSHILKLAQLRGIKIRKEPRQEINRLSSGQPNQGIIAQTSEYPYVDLKEVLMVGKEDQLILILDGTQDPHNVGALLRTADAVGVGGVIIPKDRSSKVTSTVSRVSAGGAEHAKVALVSNWTGVLKEIKKQGYWLVGLEGSADKSIFELEISGPVALVVGGEGGGLRSVTKGRCDYLCQIPMKGKIGSLNASVAGGLALYEIFRRRLDKRAN